MSFFSPTRDEFAQIVLRTLAARQIEGVYDESTFSVAAPGDLRFYLGNAYADYRRASLWNRRKVLTNYLFAFDPTAIEEPETLEQARNNLMPKVRERSYTEMYRLRSKLRGSPGVDLTQKVFADGHLTLEVVFDTPKFSRSIPGETLEKWGLTFDDALAIANENLKRRSTKGGFQIVRPGVYISTWRDTFDASRLQAPEFVSMLDVKGRYVAMIPNRDVLIVTGERDEEGLKHMANLAEAALKDPRQMTGYAFRLDAGWVPWLPEADHPSYRAFKTLQAKTIAGDYDEQKHVLDEIYKEEGSDLFVATPMFIEKGEVGPISIASWAMGVDTLLPKSDLIALGRNEGGERKVLGFSAWVDVMRVAPDLLEAQDMYPERYLTKMFPTEAQLQEIGLRDQP